MFSRRFQFSSRPFILMVAPTVNRCVCARVCYGAHLPRVITNMNIQASEWSEDPQVVETEWSVDQVVVETS